MLTTSLNKSLCDTNVCLRYAARHFECLNLKEMHVVLTFLTLVYLSVSSLWSYY